MSWTSPSYSKGAINRAGRTLASGNDSYLDILEAYDVLNNWRSSHAFPLNTIQMNLRRTVGKYTNDFVVAQRLKRVPSIVDKIQRYPKMELARMQDIGGCRAILPNVKQAEEVLIYYMAVSNVKHEIVRHDDYISNPQISGYRGAHLVFRYNSDKVESYNGFHVEMQLRSRFQHAWATAVETVDLFRKYSLKSSRGPDGWLRFFALMGSAFAQLERRPGVPNTPKTQKELHQEIADLSMRLDVVGTLSMYGAAINITDQQRVATGDYYLIVLDPLSRKLNVKPFKQYELEKANSEYTKLEQELSSNHEIVLVKAGSVDNLRLAYPNYFLDTSVFLMYLNRYTKIKPN